jgi:hypothetical protein
MEVVTPTQEAPSVPQLPGIKEDTLSATALREGAKKRDVANAVMRKLKIGGLKAVQADGEFIPLVYAYVCLLRRTWLLFCLDKVVKEAFHAARRLTPSRHSFEWISSHRAIHVPLHMERLLSCVTAAFSMPAPLDEEGKGNHSQWACSLPQECIALRDIILASCQAWAQSAEVRAMISTIDELHRIALSGR